MTADIQFRPATPSDANELAVLISAANARMASHYTPIFLQENLPPDSPDDIIDIMQRRQMFVAIIDGTIVGTCSLKEIALGMMYVDATRQGQGIGTALLGYVLNQAVTKGLRSLKVYAALNAVSFYRQNGFTPIRTEISHASFPAMLMQISLTPDIPTLMHIAAFADTDIPPPLQQNIHANAFLGNSNIQDMMVLTGWKRGLLALIAGGKEYDFHKGMTGDHIQVMNFSDMTSADKIELAMQIAQHVYYTGGRYISFPNTDLAKEAQSIYTRFLSGEIDGNTYVFHKNGFKNFVAYQTVLADVMQA